MSFLDTSPDLVSDLHDVFNMLYPPSPDGTVSDDWQDGEEAQTSYGALANTSAETVDLDGPVNGLAPLDVHEQRLLVTLEGHSTHGEKHSRIDSLLDKLSRKRIRALLDTTLPLMAHAASTMDAKSTKKRKLIQLIEPDIKIPKRMQVSQKIPIWQRCRGSPGGASVKRDRQRSPSASVSGVKTRPEYSPFSADSYLSRLQTFTLPTYPAKPSSLLAPQACAQAGWINRGGKDRLVCEVCRKAWRVEMPSKEMTGGITLSPEMTTIHQDLLLLNPPISSHLAPLAFDVERYILARGETPSVAHFEEADIELVSPLNATQTGILTKNLNLALESDLGTEALGMRGEGDAATVLSKRNHASSSSAISSTAAALAFFGWNVFRPRDLAPGNNRKPPTAEDSASDSAIVPDVLRCRICDRKLGLWAFRLNQYSSQTALPNATPKPLDVIREHREFCPIRTLAVGARDEINQPWWADAAILRQSLQTAMPGIGAAPIAVSPSSLVDTNLQGLQYGRGGLQENSRSVDSVVPKLKEFTKVDIP
ncbi:hypothetical protein QFC22_003013 [Naganishia vaughanmartiniae]|uniref:Uncharacterized protein n=1 Tax=Naganishia vaughanmartiniae TaxID=1424756 RepID=A0ACC2X7T0_9TREE|nr:hypothetical protein QFC22_003013 [Naganishia vaughanmartiniae]